MPTRQPSQRSHKVGRLQHRSGLSPRPTFHNLFASLSITVFDSAEMECSLFGHSGFSLLDEGKSDTLSLGQGDEGLLALPDHENVTETGSEGVASGILDVGNLVGTGMVLDVLEDTNTTDIVSALYEDGGTVLELDDAVDLTSLKVQLYKEIVSLLNIILCFDFESVRRSLPARENVLTLMESFFLMSGWGKRMVLPSWVTM